MDALDFVQNIKKFCELKGVKPTVACRESGVGTSFINNIEKRGSMPSVEKVQLLADYLGVTTSELLGETKQPATVSGDGQAEKLSQALQGIGIDVDKLTEAEINRIARLAKVALEE